MNDYYIYVLFDSSKRGIFVYDDLKFEYEPFYVGKGRKNRIKNTLYDKSSFKKNKIEKLKKSNIEIIHKKIKKNLSNEVSIILEKKFISKIGRRDLNKGPLVNTTDGGDGRLSSKPTQATKDKISKTYLSKKLKWKHKEEVLKKMSKNQKGMGNGFYGKTHTEENKNKQSKLIGGKNHPMYGKEHSKQTKKILKEHRKNNISNRNIKEACQKFNKEVDMYDLNLNYIKTFNSVKETSFETNINESIISKCCRGEIKKPTRYYFKYKNEKDNIKSNKFLINKDDCFFYKRNKYKLLKRNKKTCICLNDNGVEETIHVNDFKYLFYKEENNSDLTEIYLFLKNIDKSFKIKGNIIYSKNNRLQYCSILKYSEIFNNTTKIKKEDNDIIIFSDEWKENKTIIKSRLKNLIGVSKKIGARKCVIKEITDNSIVRKFLLENHQQGFVGSKVKIGLFYNDELVSLITFGSLRKNMGQKSKKDYYELLRFCNKLNYTVMGGASKLFKHFLKNYNPKEIISYADYRWSNGDLYRNLGFKELNKTIPNYFYIIDGQRKNRFNFRKDLLVSDGYDKNMTEIDIMHQRHYYRIWDLGSIKFNYKNNNYE